MDRGGPGLAAGQSARTVSLTVRCLREGEALPAALLLGFAERALRWNPEQVLVAEDAEGLCGVAILYDGGHDVVFLEHFVVHPRARGRGVAVALMRGCVTWCRARAKRVLFGYSPNPRFARRAARAGAVVLDRGFRLIALDLTRDPAYGPRRRSDGTQ